MQSPDRTDVERIEGLLRGTPPESTREAQLAGLIRELRGAPPAPPALRERVRTLGEPEPRRQQFGWRPALALVAVAAVAVAGAALFGIRGSAGDQEVAGEPAVELGRLEAADSAGAPSARLPLPAPSADRAQEWDVSLELRVPNNDRLGEASADAIRITRALGGFVVSSHVETTGDHGRAQLLVRVPSGRVQDAVAQLSELGTITGQRVSIQDRQDELDRFAQRIDSLRVQIAQVRERLASTTLSPSERLRLELQRQRLQGQLNQATRNRNAVQREVELAEISIGLHTGEGAAAPVPGPFERAARDAWSLLSRVAAGTLFLLILLSPLLVLTAAGLVGRRTYSRRRDERLLDRAGPAAPQT